ncbi:TetR/AcrR family transcriptional regulator [Isoptericola aurantiacus]|uniref:TetR/AcrR family transcriptional regulator n=1 Tax=Isoptericola aurantiacus TaxID=3377839 RepID=UPI00383A3564
MPRAGLSREAVVRIALEIVDDGGTDGFTNLSLAQVAARAGVSAPSLYKHVRSLGALRRDVAVVAVRELDATITRAVVGRSGPDALRGLAHALRDHARAHPGRYEATQVAPDPEDPEAAEHRAVAQDVVATIAAALRGFRLSETATIDAVRALRAGVHGYVVLELAGGFRLPQDVDHSFDALIDMLVTGIETLGSEGP